MGIPKIGKWLLIGGVVIVLVAYGVFATSYQGEYKVSVTFNLTSEMAGEVAITEFVTESEEMDVMSFFDELRVPSKGILNALYHVFCEFNQSGGVDVQEYLVSVTEINVRIR